MEYINTELNTLLNNQDVQGTLDYLIQTSASDAESYELIHQAVFSWSLSCGCSSYNEEDEKLMQKVFYYAEEHNNNQGEGAEFSDTFKEEDRIAELFLSLLEAEELVEHGSTIRYPWLTTRGKTLYKALKEIDKTMKEMKDKVGFSGVCYLNDDWWKQVKTESS